MRGPINIWRLVRTGATMTRAGAMGLALDALDAPWALRFFARIISLPFAWLGYRGDPSLPPVTRAITALGPAYVKFGQILSTRPDFVGDELAEQLAVLQDKLPAFPTQVARDTVEAELGRPVDELFSEFDEPIAAASIAQVHRARRRDTDQVVAVKVLRPGIERAFQRDIDAFYFVARFIEFFSPSSRRLHPTDVVRHFEGVVLGELDLRLESASAAEFLSNTKNDDGFQVPKVVWPLSSKRVMTLDWADGIPIGNLAQIDAAGHNRPALAQKVLQLFLSHALRDGYFHADMHQGNLQVAQNGDIVALDFGIMGHIDDYTRRVYAEILFGFIQRDYTRVAEVHFEAGYVPADRDKDEFARALRAVGEPIFDLDASQISMGKLLNYLFEVTERFGMETRTELILLQRTMVVVEGVARSLDPHINIWEAARPTVEAYIQDNIGPKALLRDLSRAALVVARLGPKLPEMAENLLLRSRETPAPPTSRSKWGAAGWAALGAAVMFAATLLLNG